MFTFSGGRVFRVFTFWRGQGVQGVHVFERAGCSGCSRFGVKIGGQKKPVCGNFFGPNVGLLPILAQNDLICALMTPF